MQERGMAILQGINSGTIPVEVRSERTQEPSIFSSRFPVSQRNVFIILVISAIVLVPCFWHRRIESGDLGSHVYNAWLAQLAEQGKAPGVYIVSQWTNVIFDFMLFYLGKGLGLAASEKIATSACVLVFFWGVFALMRATGAKPPWFLAPCIAMLAYGYVFHLGFMNYYLSVGLACFGLSLVWPMRKNGLIAAGLVAPVILLAHPLGFLWFLGTAAYRVLWLRVPGWWKLALPAGVVASCLAVHWFLKHSPGYEVSWPRISWRISGADEFHVFSYRGTYISAAILALALLISVLAVFPSWRRKEFWRERRILLELYLVSVCATAQLPENLHTNPSAGWLGGLATRLVLLNAIFGLCWLASLPARAWHLFYYSTITVIFFIFLHQDTSLLNRMEDSAESVTQQLQFGTRILASIFVPPNYREMFLHIPDRACVGHCFLVSNYEPSTKQFRVRTQPGSPVVTASVNSSLDMQTGKYEVKKEDLPLKQIYQCDVRDLAHICIHELSEGEKNCAPAFTPSPVPCSPKKP
jgi:hypothetical protein